MFADGTEGVCPFTYADVPKWFDAYLRKVVGVEPEGEIVEAYLTLDKQQAKFDVEVLYGNQLASYSVERIGSTHLNYLGLTGCTVAQISLLADIPVRLVVSARAGNPMPHVLQGLVAEDFKTATLSKIKGQAKFDVSCPTQRLTAMDGTTQTISAGPASVGLAGQIGFSKDNTLDMPDM